MESIADLLEKTAQFIRRQDEELADLRQREADREAQRQRLGALADLPDVLTAKDVAIFLRIKPATVYQMFRAGKIPNFGGGAAGKSVRCMKADLIEWLDRERQGDKSMDSDAAMPLRIVKGQRRKRVG